MNADQGRADTRYQGLLLLGGFALLKVLVHVGTMGLGPYGYFRDEFYYLDCASRLDWGYVDQPPLSLFILAVTRFFLGSSMFAIRVPAILAGAATVVLGGLLARAMGGGLRAQALTCLSLVAAPVFLTMSSFFSMNPFDYLLWATAAYILVCIINSDNPRLWLWFGVVAGLGLENKLSIGFFGALVAAALLLTPERKHYLNRYLWLGGGIAFLLVLPNILWQMKYGWPTLEFMHDTNKYKNLPVTLPKFLVGQILFMGPVAAPIWIAGGLYGLFAREGKRFRIFSLIYLGLLVIFYLSNGKSYYLAPIYPMLLALGAISIERMTANRPWIIRALAGVVAVTGVLFAPHAIPLLSPEALLRYQAAMGLRAPQQERAHAGVLPQHIGDRLGWNEMIAMIADAYHHLDPAERARCTILVSNYGEAGALNLFGPALGMPRAISGYMTYYLWGPGDADGEVVLAYWDDRKTLDDLFEEVTEVARFTHPYVMERQNNRPLYLCRRLKVPMAEAWPRFKRYS